MNREELDKIAATRPEQDPEEDFLVAKMRLKADDFFATFKGAAEAMFIVTTLMAKVAHTIEKIGHDPKEAIERMKVGALYLMDEVEEDCL